jgi:hypothetical protein
MKKILFIIIFTLTACSTNNSTIKNVENIKFSDDISFEEFKSKLKVYATNSPFPNIDN